MQESALPFHCLVSSNMESDLFSLFIYGMVVPLLLFLEPPIYSEALIPFCHYFCQLGAKSAINYSSKALKNLIEVQN